jgi:hypothetical protein
MSDTPVLPSWRYHVSGEARIVATVDELQALEPGQWFESPAEAADAAATASEARSGEDTRRSRR